MPAGIAAVTVKENSARRVIRYAPDGSPAVYLKIFKRIGGLRSIISTFRASNARREFETLRTLEANGIPVPRTLGAFERREGNRLLESGLLTEALPEGMSGEEVLRRERDPEVRRVLLQMMGLLVERLAELRFVNEDMHAGNLHFVALTRPDYDMYLLDVHRARYLRSRTEPWRAFDEMLPFFYNSLARVTSRLERIRFLRNLVGRVSVRWILEASRRVGERHHRSRNKRCFTNSSRYAVERTEARTVYRLREFPAEALEAVLKSHEESIRGKNAGVFKALPDRVVTRQAVETAGSGPEAPPTRRWVVGVKEFRYHPLRAAFHGLMRSPGMRAWFNGAGLEVRHVPTPRPLAFVVGWDGRERLVTDWVEGAFPLNDFLKRLFVPQCPVELRREFVRRLAREVRRLHLVAGIDHGDLKANNILVGMDGTIRFLDLDRVRFRGVVPMARRMKALAQLNAAVTPPVTKTDRLFFLACYAVYETGLWHHRKETVWEIMDMTKARKHLWPEAKGG